MCGWRLEQEDAEINLCPFDSEDSGLFAVFDGHGGDIVSNFASKYFPRLLLQNSNQRNGNQEESLRETFLKVDECLLSNVGRRIIFKNIRLKNAKQPQFFPEEVDFDAVVELDPKDEIDKAILQERDQIEKNHKLPDLYSSQEEEGDKKPGISDLLGRSACTLSINDAGGCTANVGLIKGGMVYIANAGDSRSVACNTQGTTIPLSWDHKPENTIERNRIENAGGFVEMNRVMGNLALSRAFGDFNYKVNGKLGLSQQMVIPDPDISCTSLQSLHQVILACDGIQDCVSNEELTQWFDKELKEFDSGSFHQVPKKNERNENKKEQPEVEDRNKREWKLENVVEKFLDSIVADDTNLGKGTDNMTCILVRFK